MRWPWEQPQQVHRWILEGVLRIEPEPAGLKKQDIYTGLACFLIVFGATIPVLLPFVLIKNEAVVLRVPNGLILGMLFTVGSRRAAFANMNRLKAGLALLAMGVVLVVITLLLGG